MPVLEYDFAIIGASKVNAAMASIERRFVDHNRRMVQASRRTATENARATKAAGGSMFGPSKEEFQSLQKSGQALDRQRSAALTAQYRLRERLEQKSAREAQRNVERRAQAEARAAANAQKEFRRRTGAVVDRVGSSLGGIGSAALAATGLGGGALIASRLGPAASLEKAQRALAVAGRGPGQASPLSYEQLQKHVLNVSTATGQSQEDVTAGMREYVSATGDLKGAADQIQTFGTVATAAEANVADVAKAAAYLSTAMHISAKEMPQALATLYQQGKKGAFELKDLGAAIPQLGSQAATLGMSGLKGMTTLGGLAQIAQKGTGNAAEAQTALANLFNQIVAKSGKIQSGAAFGGHKVQVFEGGDPKKKMNDIRQILADMINASGGNVQQLLDLGEIRGSKALNPMVNAYKDAGGGEAGKRAVLKMIEDASDAGGTFKDVQQDAADVMKSTSVQLEILNSKLTAAVQSKLLPALISLGPSVEKLVPLFEKGVDVLAGWVKTLADNPLKGLGELVLLKVGADLAQAGIGAAVRAILMSLLTGDAVTKGAAGVAGLAGAAGNAAGLGAAGTAALGVAGAGALAVGGLGAMGYQAYQAYQENKASGGFFHNLSEAWNGHTARSASGSDYDKLTAGARQSPPKELADAGTKLGVVADKLSKVADKLASPPPNRGNSPSPIKG